MKLNDPDGALKKFQKPAPPSGPVAVIAWLSSNPAAEERNGKTVFAQKFALGRGLHEDWRS